jgi:hypothetical protein
VSGNDGGECEESGGGDEDEEEDVGGELSGFAGEVLE